MNAWFSGIKLSVVGIALWAAWALVTEPNGVSREEISSLLDFLWRAAVIVSPGLLAAVAAVNAHHRLTMSGKAQ